MAKFTIKNVELEFDIYDLENAEKYEAQVERMREVAEAAKGEKKPCKDNQDTMRRDF